MMSKVSKVLCVLCVLCAFALNLFAQDLATAEGLAAYGTNAPTGGGGGSSATDNFTRADADPISNPMSDGSSTWTTASARWATMKISGNAATKTTSGLPWGAAKVSSPTFAADQTATITIGANMSHSVGVRMQSGSGSGYKITTYSATRLAIYREDDNGSSITETLLSFDDPGGTFTAGDTITISISGTTLTGKYNGSVVAGLTVTDATYATGQPWIAEQTSSTSTGFTATAP